MGLPGSRRPVMFSIATAVAAPARRLLLAALTVSALCALHAEARTAPAPCDEAALAPAFAFASLGTQTPIAAINCGAASQICCPGNFCNTGLVCNSNGICRTPCGGAGERCCTNQTCDAPLACNPNGICRTCGGS